MKIKEYVRPQAQLDSKGMPCKWCKKTLNVYKEIEGNNGTCRVYDCDVCKNDNTGFPLSNYYSINKYFQQQELKLEEKKEEDECPDILLDFIK